jgi:hypothetical protein
MFLIIFPVLSLLAVLRIDNYTAFTNQAIIDNPFWSLGVQVEHPYAAVSGVYEIRGYHARFDDVVSPYQVIVFADGTRWESPRKTGGPKLEEQRQIVRFVAHQCSQKVQSIAFAEHIPADKR